MRTTVDLDDHMMNRLRRIALDEGTSLRSVMERLLRAALSWRAPLQPADIEELEALHLGGPPVNLPLDDDSALLSHLDQTTT
jgi:hypothetical protein